MLSKYFLVRCVGESHNCWLDLRPVQQGRFGKTFGTNCFNIVSIGSLKS